MTAFQCSTQLQGLPLQVIFLFLYWWLCFDRILSNLLHILFIACVYFVVKRTSCSQKMVLIFITGNTVQCCNTAMSVDRYVDWHIFEHPPQLTTVRVSKVFCRVFTDRGDSQPHRTSPGGLWKQFQIQPVPALFWGRGHQRSESTSAEPFLQPWVC